MLLIASLATSSVASDKPDDRVSVDRAGADRAGADSPVAGAHLRIARPTDDLERAAHFYRAGLGFEELYRFEDHEGFDGIMLGHRGASYHLELTHKRGHHVGRAPTEDNLMVFYLPDTAAWQRAIDRLRASGYEPVKPFNPYWERGAKTFEDPDGYRIVLTNSDWSS